MVPNLLFDITGIDFDHVHLDAQAIEKFNPQRGDMRLLDGILWHDHKTGRAVAYHDVRHDAFWVQGHIPGRPLLPGVLMIEAGAQLASFMVISHLGTPTFLGFVGCDDVKFRGQVVPGDRLIILGKSVKFKPRQSTCAIQGLVNGTMVFEAVIIGMPI